MPRTHGRGRLLRFASASSIAMLLGVLLLPVASLAQPLDPTTFPAAAAAGNDCGGDTGGPEPEGSFSISGTVTNGVGAGVADIRVRANGGVNGLAETETNAQGDYVLSNLAAAPYRLSFFDESATYQSGFRSAGGAFTVVKEDALPIDVSGDLSGVNVVLPVEQLQTISGTITDSLGPVADVSLDAVSTDFPMSSCGAVSAVDGTYALTEVRTGQYRISLADQNGLHPDGYYAIAAPHFTTRGADAATLTVTVDRPGTDIAYPATFSLERRDPERGRASRSRASPWRPARCPMAGCARRRRARRTARSRWSASSPGRSSSPRPTAP